MVYEVKEYVYEGLINIIGGCCGIIDVYIVEYFVLIVGVKLYILVCKLDCMWFLGLELLEVKFEINFVNVGECCNVVGLCKFFCLINEKKYDEVLFIVCK